MASSLTKFDTDHEDLIHDVSYDFYGKRLVTCSSDQRLKVWDFIERLDASVWELNDAWKAHDSSILKAIWARPEYGQVIASCSFDRQVKIWEEQLVEPRNSQKRWAERFRLVESRGAVLDIAFSPSQNSLRLATCSSDGIVRIYEALEPTNLAQWSQMEEFEIASNQIGPNDHKGTPSGISQLRQQSQQQHQQQQVQQQQQSQVQPLKQLSLLQAQLSQASQQSSQPSLQQTLQQQSSQQMPLLQQQQQQQSIPIHSSQSAHQSNLSQALQPSQTQQSQQQLQPQLQQQQSQPLDSFYQVNTQQSQQQQQAQTQQSLLLQQAQQPSQLPYPSAQTTLINHAFGQPSHTNSTSSSASSTTSHDVSTPGVPDTLNMGVPTTSNPSTTAAPEVVSTVVTATGATTSANPGTGQGVSPGSSANISQTTAANHTHRLIDADSGYCLDWCPNRSSTAMMVIGLGKEVGARIFKHDGHNRWIPAEFLPGHTDLVHDVSWAPSMARSYQLIATASKDGMVRIFRLTEQTVPAQKPQQTVQRGRSAFSPAGTPTQNTNTKVFHIEMIACFDDHKAEVWRVEWNVTGTILSSSGDDGRLRLWTTGYDGQWRQMASIAANSQIPN
ncbi:Nucleoporin SEH1 [Choanephora cucurbitarum]|uniref:Nucleoporin SEH1 n=1 Tax=Choanephora cucurbitarum TaxID=101091 RepID=A0A1C7N7J9_9FUNG|nr:Nucleoporin SEH1 [Choanephora cucurbitarum]